jgi:hypothetical protein
MSPKRKKEIPSFKDNRFLLILARPSVYFRESYTWYNKIYFGMKSGSTVGFDWHLRESTGLPVDIVSARRGEFWRI